MRVAELLTFILERDAIRKAKEAGHPRALWTKDPILATYRFCNVRREDDAVTKWIADNWRTPYRADANLVFWMAVARLFNLPSTLEVIGPPRNFSADTMRKQLKKQREKGAIFNGAYIVSTNGKSMDKVDYLIDLVLTPLWKDRKRYRPTKGDTLEVIHQTLVQYDGLGSFMAAQVIADVKYVAPLDAAADWWTFAASGPGSRRGLNIVLGEEPDDPWKESVWRACLAELLAEVNSALGNSIGGMLHAQDLQNCLCEYSKYYRALVGGTPPKQLYKESHAKTGAAR